MQEFKQVENEFSSALNFYTYPLSEEHSVVRSLLKLKFLYPPPVSTQGNEHTKQSLNHLIIIQYSFFWRIIS